MVEPKVRTGARLLASAERVLRMCERKALGTLSLCNEVRACIDRCMVARWRANHDVLDVIFIDSLNQDIALAVHEAQRGHG